MTNDEKLDLLLDKVTGIEKDMIDVKTDMVSVKADIVDIRTDLSNVKTDMVNVKADIVDVKADLRRLHRDDILILDEVERVHAILDKHRSDKTAHTA